MMIYIENELGNTFFPKDRRPMTEICYMSMYGDVTEVYGRHVTDGMIVTEIITGRVNLVSGSDNGKAM
ncbi:hypothetical protein HAX54_048963, partial [Datura stramonium]|nr:hypothetical protein [Datura stramonium]